METMSSRYEGVLSRSHWSSVAKTSMLADVMGIGQGAVLNKVDVAALPVVKRDRRESRD